MSEANLLEMVKALQGQIKQLNQLVHFQHAEIDAIRLYAVAKIADMLKKQGLSDRKKEFAHIDRITRELYDRHISEIEKTLPALASEIDLRDTMTEPEQDRWYLLDKYFPRKDEPPSD